MNLDFFHIKSIDIINYRYNFFQPIIILSTIFPIIFIFLCEGLYNFFIKDEKLNLLTYKKWTLFLKIKRVIFLYTDAICTDKKIADIDLSV